ncbi:1268_t:CDS:2 [Diversispora eburnea]|uniref:1268_t:CDS:1 n=1 Tax=Diversispora eburnea TaxID=1213867 RepID=A0A9N9FGU5_9GLOM|nr:1268_t:CDS:2 [Diversispora eburnea]
MICTFHYSISVSHESLNLGRFHYVKDYFLLSKITLRFSCQEVVLRVARRHDKYDHVDQSDSRFVAE